MFVWSLKEKVADYASGDLPAGILESNSIYLSPLAVVELGSFGAWTDIWDEPPEESYGVSRSSTGIWTAKDFLL